MEKAKKEYCCLAALKERGWTPKLIENLLPEPTLKANPHYRSAAPMKLWDIEDVEKAEKADEFKNWLLKKNSRAEKIKETKQKKLDNLINTLPENPADAYPLARTMKRHFIINVGGTNTGKTYNALQDLKASGNGIYLAPLRLLAMEIQDTLTDEKIKCSLLTGEEEDIISDSTVMSSTVEKLNINKKYDVAVIDECQLLEDKERGGAWTRAILGVAAEKIWLCLSENALSACLALIEMCRDTYEINRYERKVPLTFTGSESINKIEPYDAVIVFSRKEVLKMAQRLNKKGHKVSAIYGALPYSSRKEQVRKYNSGETDVIVSTDAIGMGLNLPIRRVLFAASAKYDGESFRDLKSSEVKQIAGRAGRYGKFDEGFVGTVEEASSNVVNGGLTAKDKEIKKIRLSFPESLIGYKEKSLTKIMKLWKQIDYGNRFEQANIEQIIDRVSFLEKNYPENDKEMNCRLATVMFDNENTNLFRRWSLYCYFYLSDRTDKIQLPMGDMYDLQSCENYSKEIDLYYSFSKAVGIPVDLKEISDKRLELSNKINDFLLKKIKENPPKNKPRYDSYYADCFFYN